MRGRDFLSGTGSKKQTVVLVAAAQLYAAADRRLARLASAAERDVGRRHVCTRTTMRLRAVVATTLALVGLTACAGPVIYSTYQSMAGSGGGTRSGAHAGVDFGDLVGGPVLAAADGLVVSIVDRPTYYDRDTCGRGVLLSHSEFARYAVYCHLSQVSVTIGQRLKRGDIIGAVGTTGFAERWASRLPPHVHMELCADWCPSGHADGNLRGTEDPLAITVGCFDPKKSYPNDRLVLTYPTRCSD